MLARFDKYIGPILTNVFSKITHLDVIKQWNENATIIRRFSMRNQSMCERIFASNSSLSQPSLQHEYAELYR